MLAPIALYDDALLSQVLMAASYPLEIVEAARWSQATPTSRAMPPWLPLPTRHWDVSVKSPVAFLHPRNSSTSTSTGPRSWAMR